MKRILACISIIGLLGAIVNCGGGGSSTISSGTTDATIHIGDTRAVSNAAAKIASESSTIPADVKSITFRISAPDMAPIEKTVPVNPPTTISESFKVPNGPNRYFEVFAMNAAGTILYSKGIYANMEGEPVTLTIRLDDKVAPSFPTPEPSSPIATATAISSSQINLSWSGATDNVTAAEDIVYLVYLSTVSGQQDYTSPSRTVDPPGVLTYSVTGLSPATTYFFVILAVDEGGNKSAIPEFPEISATTLPPTINGVCGPSNGGSFYSEPTNGLCSAGTPSTVSGGSGVSWTWTCKGSNNTTIACSANSPVDGVCGPSNNMSFYFAPTNGFCSVGTPSGVIPNPDCSFSPCTPTFDWIWSCQGINGGITWYCGAYYDPGLG